jgi:hypothetical protein
MWTPTRPSPNVCQTLPYRPFDHTYCSPAARFTPGTMATAPAGALPESERSYVTTLVKRVLVNDGQQTLLANIDTLPLLDQAKFGKYLRV